MDSNTTIWQERAVSEFLSGLCATCSGFTGAKDTLLRFIASRGITEQQVIDTQVTDALATSLREACREYADAYAQNTLDGPLCHGINEWQRAIKRAQAAITPEPEAPLTVQWHGINLEFEPKVDGQPDIITYRSGIPEGATLPEWVKVGTEVKRWAEAPRFRRTGADGTVKAYGWSEHVPIGTVGKIKVLDNADNTALVDYERANGGNTDAWIPFIDLLPIPSAEEQPFGDVETVAEVSVEAEPAPEVPTDPKDAKIAELEAEVTRLRTIERAARGAAVAWADGVNAAANEAADRQNYCSEYEDITGGQIWPEGERSLRNFERRHGIPAGFFSTPEFEERTKDFIVDGYAELTLTVRVPISTTVTARDEDVALEEARDGDHDGDYGTSEIIDAIRSGSWDEDDCDIQWQSVCEA